MKIAFLFPGQGSQYVGMGQDLFKEYNAAREVFLEVDDVLEEKLSTLIFEGNIEKLTLTKNAQPAIMAVSIAVLRVMLHRGLDFEKLDIFAGHSLGEYTALCASGVLSLKDTTIILRQRGLAMQKAVAEGEGLMVAVLGMESEVVRNLMIDGKFDSNLIQVANDNDPSQVVISGKKKVVIQFAEFLKRNGAKRIIHLAVSAPFHSPLMAPAALTMRNELEKVDFANPIIPIIQNFDLNVLYRCDGLVDRLVNQICGTVRWRESLVKMVDDFQISNFFEIGPSKVLTGTVKRTVPGSKTQLVGLTSEIDEALEVLNV